MDQPGRRQLPHGGPPWACDLTRETYFLTICARDRITRSLIQDDIPKRLIDAVHFYNEKQKWWTSLAVIMPDHIHLLVTFPNELAPVVRAWKHWTSRRFKVNWQRDFFDHRLRKEEKENETIDYILHNPVRAGLVDDWQKWPYFWIAED